MSCLAEVFSEHLILEDLRGLARLVEKAHIRTASRMRPKVEDAWF